MFYQESNFDAQLQIWSGKKVKEFYNPKITLGEVVRHYLKRNSKNIGQISAESNVSLSNAEILLRSQKIGRYLQDLNVQIGDVVGIIATNTENLAPLVFGLLYCGAALNTLDTSFSMDEIMGFLNATKPTIVFCDSNKYTTVKHVLQVLQNTAPIFVIDGNVEDEETVTVEDMLAGVSDDEAYEFRPNEPEDGRTATALIVCSSGTTGPSKGVCLSHSSLLRIPVQPLINTGDVYLCFSSLYWLSGFSTLLLGTIHGATRIISSKPFSPESMLQFIEQYKVSKLLLTPSQLELTLQTSNMSKRDLSSLEICLCSGSLVLASTCEKVNKHLPNVKIAIGYGLTELGGLSNLNFDPYKHRSVGKLSNNVIMKIIDETGRHLGPNQHGEICAKVPYRFLGYYGNETGLPVIVDKDNFIHTGDIGYFDDEGFLFVIGRSKEIMKYKNFPVSPADIENFLLNLPGIEQVCVCGVPDPVTTDLPAALVVRSEGSSITEKHIHDYVKQHLSDSKQLRGGVYFVKKIPETASGKHQRSKVKAIVVNMYNERKANGYEFVGCDK